MRPGHQAKRLRCQLRCLHLQQECTSSMLGSGFLLVQTLGDSRRWFKYLNPCHPRARPGLSSWLQGSGPAQFKSSLGCSRHLRSQQADGSSISLSRSLARQLSHSPLSSPSLPPSTSHMGKTKKCSKVSRCHKRRIQAFHDQKLNLGLSVAQISRKKCFRTPTDAATPSLKEVS